ncbi:MAG: hypothetical protein ABW321_05150 [Polyangiales bacterium]
MSTAFLGAEPSASRTTARWSTAAPYLVLAAFCAWTFHHTVDDAFISFRYAENFARGLGLVYNPGERVEGYSNPLWVYLLSVPALIGISVELAAKLLGVLAALATLLLFGRVLGRGFGVTSWVRTAGLLFLGGHISLVYYAVAGLETVLYTLLVLALHAALLERRFALAAVAAALAAICRPEGVLLTAALAIGLLLAPERRRVFVYLALPVLVFGLQLAFRHAYYGTWVPNTYHAKSTPTLGLAALLWQQTRAFVLGTSTWALQHLALGVLGVLGLQGMWWFRRVQPAMLVSIAGLGFFVFISVVDWMSFGRFYLPLLPLVLVYAFAALDHVRQRAKLQPRIVHAAVGALVAFSWGSSAYELWQLDHGETHWTAMSGRAYEAPAEYMRTLGAPNDLIAAPEIGVLAHVTKLRMLDLWGLTDARIPPLLGAPDLWDQLAPDHLVPYASYVLAQHPRFVVIYVEEGRLDPLMRSLHTQMQTAGTYQLGRSFDLNSYTKLDVYVARPASESDGPHALVR